MLNNPIRYTGSTGHRCKDGDENTWGYCGDKIPAPNQVKEKDRERYLRDIGWKCGIELASGDHWHYIDTILSEGGITYGWTPSRADDPYLNGSGEKQYASDTAVFITGDGFNACDTDVCIAGLKAYEAVHSWIELKIEQTSTAGHPKISEYTVAKEMYADTIAFRYDSKQLMYSHYMTKANDCEQYFHNVCSSQTMLEEYYEINLSNIPSLVYGK